jgi:AraC-like DNA-binding protein
VDGSVAEPTFDSAPMVNTTDVDVARELLSSVYVPMELTPVGRTLLNIRLNAVQLPELTLGYVGLSGDVLVRTADVSAFHVNIVVSGHVVNRWAGRRDEVITRYGSAATFMPGAPAEVVCSANTGVLCLKVLPQDIRHELEALLDGPVRSPIVFARYLDLTTTTSRSWMELVRIFARECGRSDGILSHPLALANLQRMLIQGLLLTQPHTFSDDLSRDQPPARAGVVRLAIDLLQAYPESAWTTGELARATGVSARALQKAFARAGELPPMTYLRQLRLKRVHDELAYAGPTSVTVTAVASRWGFVHFGRFAHQYCLMFGETPSQTLRTAVRPDLSTPR